MLARLTLATALTAALLALTGCGGDTSIADPPVAPPSTSPPPTHPTRRETPEHFIRHFIAVSNAMEWAGGTRDFLALTSGCDPCNRLAGQVREARSHGGFYRSRGWTLRAIRSRASHGTSVVTVKVAAAPTSYKMASDSPVQHYTGGPLTFQLALRRHENSWLVTSVFQVATR